MDESGLSVDLAALDGQANVWTSGRVPNDRQARARSVFGLAADEAIHVLHDASWLGDLGHGFVLTDRRFAVARRFGTPSTFTFVADLDRFGETLLVDGVGLELEGWSTEAADALLRLIRATLPDPMRWPDVVLSTVRRELGNVDGIAFAPDIPAKREAATRTAHGMPDDERVLAVLDLTAFGTAALHWVFTDQRFGWRQTRLDVPTSVAWSRLPSEGLYVMDDEINVAGGLFQLTGGLHGLGRALKTLVALIPTEARNPRFEARIRADPDDEAAWQVYADWFEEQGHPRAALIRAHRAGRSGEDVLEKHRLVLDPGIQGVEQRRWRSGFWDELVLYATVGRFGMYESHAPRLALAHPSAWGLRRLQVGSEENPVREEAPVAVLAKCLDLELPFLREIEVHVAFDGPWVRRIAREVEEHHPEATLHLRRH
ncbi:MAG: TIGR02996 domain-containing protein [Alphaproteobacteria bacterium]|nr:TIGR02996 domain-containing protein [Alphaproteobacteria bacterium]